MEKKQTIPKPSLIERIIDSLRPADWVDNPVTRTRDGLFDSLEKHAAEADSITAIGVLPKQRKGRK